MDIEEAIVTRLSAQVSALNGKIYPASDVPQKVSPPYCTYQKTGTSRYSNLYEQGAFEPTFEFVVYGATYSSMRSLRKSTREAFEYAVGQYATGAPYIEAAIIVNELDGFDVITESHSGILEITFFYS